jgi:hypothetical protein
MQEDRNLILMELREQTKWLRLAGFQVLRSELNRLLRTDKQRAVYELSDGHRTVREVARLAGVGVGSVSRLWSLWIAAGVCSESPSAPGRAQHLAPLSQLGPDASVSNTIQEPSFTGDEDTLEAQ